MPTVGNAPWNSECLFQIWNWLVVWTTLMRQVAFIWSIEITLWFSCILIKLVRQFCRANLVCVRNQIKTGRVFTTDQGSCSPGIYRTHWRTQGNKWREWYSFRPLIDLYLSWVALQELWTTPSWQPSRLMHLQRQIPRHLDDYLATRAHLRRDTKFVSERPNWNIVSNTFPS